MIQAMNRADKRASRRQPRAVRESAGRPSKTKLPFPYSIFANVKLFYFVGIVVMMIGLIAGVLVTFGANGTTTEENQEENETTESTVVETEEAPPFATYESAPAMTIDTNGRYIANIVTDKGTIRAELFASAAPQTVNNFVFLARQGFYNGLGFHYVQDGWVAQTGDPACQPSSSGCEGIDGPGYNIPLEQNSQSHTAGTLAMVRSGDVSHGSQFYVAYDDLGQRLDATGGVVFGRVLSGMDVLQSLAETNPRVSPPADYIISVTIEEQQPAS
jgi:cyclophilin family peptidyl-prolyl cis-trans isomerase